MALPDLRNVIVFALGSSRYAIELRFIREVITLGFVTTVPTAPDALAGVINLRGAILPVLDLAALHTGLAGPPARQGDGALVLEGWTGSDEVVCALRVDQVDHVASLRYDRDAVIDSAGRPLALLDPAGLIRRAVELVAGGAR